MRPFVTLVLAYVGFVSLGMPDTVLGAAWPAMRAEWGLPLDAAGGAVLLTSLGVVLSSAGSAALRARLGTGAVLVGSSGLAAAALAATSFAPSFAVALAAAFVAGLGGGAIDAALNDHVARHHSARHMNWLHASWGIGAAIAPAVVAATLHSGHSWRLAYFTLAAAEIVLGASFLVTRGAWGDALASDDKPGQDLRPSWSSAQSARVLLFFFYTGVESAMGLWIATLLVTTRGTSAAKAGSAAALYWGGLTLGRVVIGWVVGRLGQRNVLRLTMAAAAGLLLVLALPIPPTLTIGGFALLGFAFGPIFPLLMHETPARFPGPQGARLVGLQIAGASAGVATLPWLLGAAGRWITPHAIVPLALALFGGVLLLERKR